MSFVIRILFKVRLIYTYSEKGIAIAILLRGRCLLIAWWVLLHHLLHVLLTVLLSRELLALELLLLEISEIVLNGGVHSVVLLNLSWLLHKVLRLILIKLRVWLRFLLPLLHLRTYCWWFARRVKHLKNSFYYTLIILVNMESKIHFFYNNFVNLALGCT